MHATYVNCSADHFPQHAAGRRAFCVGDGYQCLATFTTEIEALDFARQRNRDDDTDQYIVYCVDLDERDDTGAFVFPHERADCRFFYKLGVKPLFAKPK